MSGAPVSHVPLPEFVLRHTADAAARPLLSVILEVTARCNNDCRHCFINRPAKDREARSRELSLDEIEAVTDEAAGMGALWCVITGGEPLIRPDFEAIYRGLKEKGFLVSVFTNGTLISPRLAKLFSAYPPRNLEMTVYGTTRETHERVTRTPGSYDAFQRGLSLLQEHRVQVNLKAMVLTSNHHELPEMAAFCRRYSHLPFRFDTVLHLRYDVDPARNADIRAERLAPQQAAALEQSDAERFDALKRVCEEGPSEAENDPGDRRLFWCSAGRSECVVGYDGQLRVCPALWHPDFVCDLRQSSLTSAWAELAPRVRGARGDAKPHEMDCRKCALMALCMNCPGHVYLETGCMEGVAGYFCDMAKARGEMVNKC